MNGRQETNLKIENKIKRLLRNAPKVVIDYSYNFNNKTEKTKLAYLRYVLEFCGYFNNEVTNLTRTDINKYMEVIKYGKNGRELSASVRNAKLASIKDFYSYLYDDGKINNNPAISVKPPKEDREHEIVALTADEINIIKNNILNGVGSDLAKWRQEKWKTRDLAIFMLGCTTGLRCSAISEINIEDINFDNNTVSVTEKGNKVRIVHLGTTTTEALHQWIEDREDVLVNNTNALFVSRFGDRISNQSIAKLISKYSVGINKHITPHKMRSSCATNLYDQTHDIYLVQEVLGHKNIANTRRYARLSEERKKEAADILNDLF